MKWKRSCLEAAILFAAAILFGTIWNNFRSEAQKLSWKGSYTFRKPPAVAAPSVVDRKPVEFPANDPRALAPAKDMGSLYLEIGKDVAARLQEAGALFLDARRSSVYETGHIAGAENVAVWEHDADARIQAILGKSAEKEEYDRIIVIYCSGGNCNDSERLAEKLAMVGFFNVYLYKDGYHAWMESGLPIRRGKNP
jgi:rhodanese-related sulfurtransferase